MTRQGVRQPHTTPYHMLVSDAQAEVRRVYRGGLIGNTVAALLWFGSACFATSLPIDPRGSIRP